MTPLFYKSRCSLILSSSSSKCIINHSAVTMASGVLNLTLEQYIFIILIELDFFYIQHSLTHMHHKLPNLILLTIAVVTITISLFHCNCIPETLKRKMDRRRKLYSESRSFTNTCSFCRWTVTYTSPGSYVPKPYLDIFFVIVVAEGHINVLFKRRNSDWCPLQSPLRHRINMELHNKSL